MIESVNEFLTSHVSNTLAAERNFEDVLATFAKSGEQEEVQVLFGQLSQKAKTQHERLEVRLRELGRTPSTLKSLAAHFLNYSTTLAQTGQYDQEKNTQHLIMTHAAAAALHESLSTIANCMGDAKTEQLARKLQFEEREEQETVWGMLGRSASRAHPFPIAVPFLIATSCRSRDTVSPEAHSQ